MKHIGKERPDFDLVFLVESLKEQKKELEMLSKVAGVRISLADEDMKTMSLLPKIAQLLSFPPLCFLNIVLKFHVWICSIDFCFTSGLDLNNLGNY